MLFHHLDKILSDFLLYILACNTVEHRQCLILNFNT